MCDVALRHTHLAQQKMDPANDPRSVFEQRRRELRRCDDFLDILVSHRRATLATRRVADSHNSERMWIRQTKERVTCLATTDLNFPFDETRIFKTLNRHVRRFGVATEQFGRVALLVRVARGS